MKRSTTLSRFQRLDLLTARLKTDEALIVRDLAAELGVSGRTLARDIELLRDRGLP
ncbi:MAG: HTH domain-containing protein, partial [Pseudomonadota bacterium]